MLVKDKSRACGSTRAVRLIIDALLKAETSTLFAIREMCLPSELYGSFPKRKAKLATKQIVVTSWTPKGARRTNLSRSKYAGSLCHCISEWGHWNLREAYNDKQAYIALKSVSQRGLGKVSFPESELQYLNRVICQFYRIVVYTLAKRWSTGL